MKQFHYFIPVNSNSFKLFLCAAFLQLALLSTIFAKTSYFPQANAEWKTIDPSKAGWDETKLEEVTNYTGSQKSSGLLIVQNGKILVEHYWPRENYFQANAKIAARLHGTDAYGGNIEDVASVQKSIASLIVGIAQEKGLLSINDPVHKHMGIGWSRATKDQEASITVRHLISMSSGLKDDLSYEAPVGTRWRYNTTAYSHSMHVVAATSGMTAKEVVEQWLSKPLGLTDSEWIYRRGGETANIKNSNVFGWATTNRDLAKVGILVLNHGIWDGETVLGDKAYLHDATHPSQEINPAYGYLWWLNGQSSVRGGNGLTAREGALIKEAPEDLFAAQGALQRKLYVVPSMNLVITRLGNQPKDRDFNDQFWKRLMAAAP